MAIWIIIRCDGSSSEEALRGLEPGISENVHDQRKSLEWIRQQSFDPNCIEILACHDTEVNPHTIEL